ncbi:MAG: nucleotidyltransferase family protein [Oscillospiraceae bacterium]|nr:nucleotidyltransferase family protein [Oscillospiraceae bacterium]
MDLSIPYLILNEVNRGLFGRAVLPESEVDWVFVCRMCKFQSITGLFWSGLQKRQELPEARFIEHFQKKEIQERFQYEHQQKQLNRVVQMLEEEKNPYVLLKGSRMRGFYPDPVARTSCDIDILFKGNEERIHERMLEFGYEFVVDAGTTINYLCSPVEFEMHRCLFDNHLDFHGFFDKVWDYARPVGEGTVEYVLTEEFFYVYMIAHMAKHFTRYGSGVRPVIDLYLYNSKPPVEFDRQKAEEILQEIGLLDFERRLKALTKAWFETGKLTEMDQKLTDYIMEAGIYGDSRTMSANTVKDASRANTERLKVIRGYVFPPAKVMKRLYPRLMKCSVMLPVAWVCRWYKGAFTDSRGTATSNLKRYASVDERFVAHVSEMVGELGLQDLQK